MLNVLDEWETFGHQYRLCRGLISFEGWTRLEPLDASWALGSRFATPASRKALLGGFHGSSGALPTNLGEPGVLEREVDQRRLDVYERPIASIQLGAHAPRRETDAAGREAEPHQKRAWIDILVIDDSEPARALSQAGFRLRLPDQSTQESVLDGQGRVHLDDIAPGRCWLELTDPGRGIDP